MTTNVVGNLRCWFRRLFVCWQYVYCTTECCYLSRLTMTDNGQARPIWKFTNQP